MNVLNVVMVAGGIISAVAVLVAIIGSSARKVQKARADHDLEQFFEFVDGLSRDGQEGRSPTGASPNRPDNSGPAQMKLPMRKRTREIPEAKTAIG